MTDSIAMIVGILIFVSLGVAYWLYDRSRRLP